MYRLLLTVFVVLRLRVHRRVCRDINPLLLFGLHLHLLERLHWLHGLICGFLGQFNQLTLLLQLHRVLLFLLLRSLQPLLITRTYTSLLGLHLFPVGCMLLLVALGDFLELPLLGKANEGRIIFFH